MDLDIKEILIQIVAFLLMLWVLKKFGWKPLLNVMEERKKAIQSEFDAIAEARKETEMLAKSYQDKLSTIDAEGRLKIQEAVRQGQKIV